MAIMKTLVVEDDFISRAILQDILSPFSACDMATDGREAIWAFEQALKNNNPYDLICLDIMLPVADGYYVLDQVRKIESQQSLFGLDVVKIIMITNLYMSQNILKAFNKQCEDYLIKPVSREQLINKLKDMDLLEPLQPLSREEIRYLI